MDASELSALCRTLGSDCRHASPATAAAAIRHSQRAHALSSLGPVSPREHQFLVDSCKAALRAHAASAGSGPLTSVGMLVAASTLALATIDAACRLGFAHRHLDVTAGSRPIDIVSASISALLDCISSCEHVQRQGLHGAVAATAALLSACCAAAVHLPAVIRRSAPRLVTFCFNCAEHSPESADAATETAGALLTLLAWSNIEKPKRGASVPRGGAAAVAPPRTTAELHVYILPLLQAADSIMLLMRECVVRGPQRPAPWSSIAVHVFRSAEAAGHRASNEARMSDLAAGAGSGSAELGGAAHVGGSGKSSAAVTGLLASQLLCVLRVIGATLAATRPSGSLGYPPGAIATTLPLAGILHAAAAAADPRALEELGVPLDVRYQLSVHGVNLALGAIAAAGTQTQRFRRHILDMAGRILLNPTVGGTHPQLHVLAATLVAAFATQGSLAALPVHVLAVVRSAVLACVAVVEGLPALPPQADGYTRGALGVLTTLVQLQQQGSLPDDLRFAIDRCAVLALRPPASPAGAPPQDPESAVAAAVVWRPPQASFMSLEPLLPLGAGSPSALVRSAQVSLLTVCIDTPWASGARSPLLPVLLEAAHSLGLHALTCSVVHPPRLDELAAGIVLASVPRAIEEPRSEGRPANAYAPLSLFAPREVAPSVPEASAGPQLQAASPANADVASLAPVPVPGPEHEGAVLPINQPSAIAASAAVTLPPAARNSDIGVSRQEASTVAPAGEDLDADFPDIVGF
jgi:hypothetical protein